jgi:hypothetical protein
VYIFGVNVIDSAFSALKTFTDQLRPRPSPKKCTDINEMRHQKLRRLVHSITYDLMGHLQQKTPFFTLRRHSLGRAKEPFWGRGMGEYWGRRLERVDGTRGRAPASSSRDTCRVWSNKKGFNALPWRASASCGFGQAYLWISLLEWDKGL